METVYVVLVVIAISVILTIVSKRQKDSSWQGTVTKIEEYSYDDSEERHHEGIKIFYRRDGGRKGKLDVNKAAYHQLYSELKVGDILIKDKGEYMPHRSQTTQTQNV